MRVAVDARLVTYQRAGIGNYVLSLLDGMRSTPAPPEIEVLVSRKDSDIAAALPGIRRRRCWTPPHHRFEQLALAIEIAPIRCDVYHAPDFIPPFLRRVPAVVTVHDLAFLRLPGLLTDQSRRYYGQIGRAVQSATRIIAVSEATRRDLIELVGAPAGRIDLVYEAADRRYRRSADDEIARARSAHGLPDEYFLFVGTREPRKNLPRLLAAYARAQAPGRPDLAIVGRRGWLADDLADQAHALGIANRVHFLGGLPPEQIVPLYSGAVGLVFPSLYEGFGLPAVEAMACGTPVIASTAGSLPEIVGSAGLLVDPFDIDALADAMIRLWREHDLRAELGTRGLARAGLFSWERAAAETIDVYRRAA